MKYPILTLLMLAATSTAVKADLVVLQYHHVSDSTPPATSTSVSLFDAQLDMIASLDLEIVPLLTGTKTALEGTSDKDLVAITFDDAYESVYSTAAPRLEARGYPYTVFVNTNAVGSPGYMTWDQLKELSTRDNVTIANHSHDHKHLVRRPDEQEDQWENRIEESLDTAQETLESRLGTTSRMFAYPFGEFDSALEQKIAERDWFGFGQQSGPVGKYSDTTRLPRFPMADAYGQLDSLEDKVLSLAFPVDADSLPDGVITHNPPRLSFTLDDRLSKSRLSCFASGIGRIDIESDGNREIRVQAPVAIDRRRFRYNCTHPAGSGRFYWLSQAWLDLSQPED